MSDADPSPVPWSSAGATTSRGTHEVFPLSHLTYRWVAAVPMTAPSAPMAASRAKVSGPFGLLYPSRTELWGATLLTRAPVLHSGVFPPASVSGVLTVLSPSWV